MSGDVWLSPAESGGVGTWFGPGFADLSGDGGSTVAIQFTDDAMALVGHRHASIVNIQGLPACIVELLLSCSV